MRIVLYNSAARGAGQYVRSLKLANLVTSSDPGSTCTIVAGNSVVDRLLPDHTTVVRLPQISKQTNGAFIVEDRLHHSRHGYRLELSQALAERKQLINDVLDSCVPDVFIVDSRAAGLSGELVVPLERLSSLGTRRILLYRDIVDSPELTVERWQNEGVYQIIENLYESIVFLGEQWLFDAVGNYRLRAVKDKVFHVGILGASSSRAADWSRSVAGDRANLLVTVGGGYDGDVIVDAVCNLLIDSSLRYDCLTVTIVLGAHSPLKVNAVQHCLEAANVRAKVIGHLPDLAPEIDKADVIISMCGYNSIFEIIQARKKVIVVPRSHSGCEQLIRANILRAVYDGLWIIPQNEVSPERLARGLADALSAPSPRKLLHMNGAANILKHLALGRGASSTYSDEPISY
jgi:predicted glycosyltransferase